MRDRDIKCANAVGKVGLIDFVFTGLPPIC